MRDNLPLLPIGTSRDIEFRVGRELGRGAMGVVRLAHQAALGRDVAIKTVLSAGINRGRERALLHEARAMGMVEHPGVVPVHSIGQDDDGRPVIVMKRVEGTTWDLYVDEKERPDTDDILGFHIGIAINVCRALEFAHHRGIVHRDVKPENVMIGRFGETYLLDWGLAASVDFENQLLPHVNETKGVIGTPVYLAPEMTVGEGQLTGRHSDIYLVGAVLYHAVTGRVPNTGKSLFDVLACSYEGRPRPYPDGFSDELREVLETAMAHDASQRYASMAELREALESFAQHRNSYDLADTAADRLEALGDLIAAGAATDAVHQAFGEARFGFLSALQIWNENEDARDGLQRCLTTMIEYELDQQNVAAAQALASQLPAPDPALSNRIDELAQKVEERDRALRKLAYDYDENVGIEAKRWVVGVMAGSFAVSPVAIAIIEEMTVPRGLHWLTDDPVVLAANLIGLMFLPVLVVFHLVTRRRYRDHKVSRVFVRGFTFMYIFGFGARTTTLWADAPLHLAAGAESTIFACGLFMLGMSIDRRLFAAGLGFAIAILPMVLFPKFTVEFYSAGAVLACLAFLFFDDVAPENLRREAEQ